MSERERFVVSLWHGEGGSFAEVRDREHPDNCLGQYTTRTAVLDGSTWRDRADAVALKLNTTVATGGSCRVTVVQGGERCEGICEAIGDDTASVRPATGPAGRRFATLGPVRDVPLWCVDFGA